MTNYLKPSFTVAQRGRSPDGCQHGWTRDNGQCVLCGSFPPLPDSDYLPDGWEYHGKFFQGPLLANGVVVAKARVWYSYRDADGCFHSTPKKLLERKR